MNEPASTSVDLPPTLPPEPRSGTTATSSEPPQTVSLRPGSAGAAETVIASGPVIPGYELLELIGRGGMGVVYKARQIELNRLLAIKMIVAGELASPELHARFRTEAQAVARLSHPNIVQIHEIGQHHGRLYFSLEYVPGGNLAERLAGTPQPPAAAAELVATLAEAVHYAHEQGVVHRDLKPGNILLTQAADDSLASSSSKGKLATGSTRPSQASSSGSRQAGSHVGRTIANYGVPKITDFGLAKQLDANSSATQSGEILGTPSYMAPEQATGSSAEIRPATDVYALGAILYELLTGRPPFRGATVLETLELVRHHEPVAPRQLQPRTPRDLETICLTCLRKEPQRRYATAAALAEDLNRWLAGEPILARPVGIAERSYRWCRRNPSVAGLIAASILVVSLLVLGAWTRQQLRQTDALAKANANAAQSSAKAAEANAKAAQAATEAANTHQYYSLVNQARERVGSSPLGWTWTTGDDVQAAAALRPSTASLAELRSLAASALSRFDMRDAGTLAKGFAPGAIAISPDGKRLAIAQSKNNLTCTVLLIDLATKKTTDTLKYSVIANNFLRALSRVDSPQDGFRSLAFSPDGRWLAAGTKSGRIVCWDLSDSQTRPTVWQAHGSDDAVVALAFAPDGLSLISGSSGQGLKRWQVAAKWAESPLNSDLAGITDLAVTQGGNRVAVVANHRLQICNLADGALIATEPDEIGAWKVALSPDGRLAIAKAGDLVELIDVARAESVGVILRFPEDEPPGTAAGADFLDFSPDGSLAATAWDDQRVRVWDLASGKLLASVPIAGGFQQCKFSADGKFLAIAAETETRLFEIQSAHIERTIGIDARMAQSVTFASAGKHIITAAERGYLSTIESSTLQTWDAETGQLADSMVAGPLARANCRFHSLGPRVVASPRGEYLAQVASNLGVRLLGVDGTSPPVDRLAGCPLGAQAVAVHEAQFVSSPALEDSLRDDPLASDGRAIRLSGGPEPREVRWRLPGAQRNSPADGWVIYAALRADRFAQAGRFVGELRAGDKSWSQERHLRELGHLHYSLVVVGTVHEELDAAYSDLDVAVTLPAETPADSALWIDHFLLVPVRSEHWAERLKLFAHGPLCFAPDGNRVWGIVDQQRVVSWSVPDMTIATDWNDATAGTFRNFVPFESIAAGDQWIVAGRPSGFAYAFSAEAGEKIKDLPGPGGAIRSVAILPPGNRALFGTLEGRLRIVRLPDGETIADLLPHAQSVECIAITPDGNFLATGSHDGTVRLWRPTNLSYELLVTLPSLSRRVREIHFDPAGQSLVVLSEPERGVRRWRLDQLAEQLQSWNIGW